MPNLDDDEAMVLLAEHHPDQVLPEIDGPVDWGWWGCEAVNMTLMCGCTVPVKTGDTIWFGTPDETGARVPVAVEPVTVH